MKTSSGVLLPVEYTFGDVGFDSEVQDCWSGRPVNKESGGDFAPFQIHSNVTSLLSGEMSVKGP